MLRFVGGQSFERFASAHTMFDYSNCDDHQDRLVWAPFHFLPGADGASFEEQAVCKPNSAVAQEMVRQFLAAPRRDNRLHHLGILLHTYVDTWAHQGFSGIISKGNLVSELVTEHADRASWWKKLKGLVMDEVDHVESRVAEFVKVGHGAALHYPDLPWLNWSYTNGFGEKVTRKNLPEFVAAANMARKVVSSFVGENIDFMNQPDLEPAHQRMIETILGENRSEDADERLQYISTSFGGGRLAEIEEIIPPYIAKGLGSWKHAATGIAVADDGVVKPQWTPAFENSDYRKFHDGVKEHRLNVSQFVLPKFGIRLA